MRCRTRSLGPAAVALLAALLACTGAGAETYRSHASRADINWAVTWINNALPQFMQKGIIAKISNKDDAFHVYAGKPWYQLSFTQQGEFLRNLSRAREIIGHPPSFAVTDSGSEQTIARVSGSAIEILTPTEGFKYYLPPAEDTAQPPQSPAP